MGQKMKERSVYINLDSETDNETEVGDETEAEEETEVGEETEVEDETEEESVDTNQLSTTDDNNCTERDDKTMQSLDKQVLNLLCYEKMDTEIDTTEEMSSCDAKCDDNCFATLVPKCESLAKSTDPLLKPKPIVKDASTDPRCRFREFDHKLIDWTTGHIGEQSAPNDGQEVKTFYRCFKCDKEIKTKVKFRQHFKRSHSLNDCPEVYLKYRRIVDKKCPKSESKSKHKKCKRNHRFSDYGPKVSHKWRKHNPKHNPEVYSKILSTGAHSDQNSQSSHSNVSTLKYKIVPKCKLCTFTPLVDPFNSIELHIRSEHRDMIDEPVGTVDHLFTNVLIKLKPKTY